MILGGIHKLKSGVLNNFPFEYNDAFLLTKLGNVGYITHITEQKL
jgi:hypothetical protein